MSARILRFVYWLWFLVVPLALAALMLWLLTPPEGVPSSGLRWLARDQPVPALIVFFTIFSVVLYHFRHDLPLARFVGVRGREDLPRILRRDYEHALHLLDEADRILKRREQAIEREVPRRVRDELRTALADLRQAVDRQPIDIDEFPVRLRRAAKLVDRHLARWQKGELREYAESIGLALGVALLLRAFVVEAFKIPSGSMLPTLQIQDHIFVNKFTYGPNIPLTKKRIWQSMPPKRGDIIVFEFPYPEATQSHEDFIKRVIALPGDTLEAVGGHPIINGWKVPNCRVGSFGFEETSPHSEGELFVEYLGEYAYLTQYAEPRRLHQGPYVVAPGEVWVMGDNRHRSSDSREWRKGDGGGVPYSHIKGRALFVWLNFAPNGGISWDRLFTNVMGKPRLPKGAPSHLVQGIERCLAQRPTPEAATPPPPRGSK